MTHQVLVSVAKQVVSLGTATTKVEIGENRDKLGEAVLHLLALAEFLLIIEIGLVNHLLQVIGLSELANDFVDLVADLLVAL